MHKYTIDLFFPQGIGTDCRLDGGVGILSYKKGTLGSVTRDRNRRMVRLRDYGLGGGIFWRTWVGGRHENWMRLVHVVCIGGCWEFDSCHSHTVLHTYIYYLYTWLNGSCQTICKIPLDSINQTHLILVELSANSITKQRTLENYFLTVPNWKHKFDGKGNIGIWYDVL